MLTLVDIRNLVGQSESLRLEFKEARGVTRLENIGKHVSAMANSRGGTIIYGIAETPDPSGGHHNVAGSLTPITTASREAGRISTYLAQRISPMLPAFEVYAVEASPGTDLGFVVVEIGESIRGHQAPDGRF